MMAIFGFMAFWIPFSVLAGLGMLIRRAWRKSQSRYEDKWLSQRLRMQH